MITKIIGGIEIRYNTSNKTGEIVIDSNTLCIGKENLYRIYEAMEKILFPRALCNVFEYEKFFVDAYDFLNEKHCKVVKAPDTDEATVIYNDGHIHGVKIGYDEHSNEIKLYE